MSADITIQSAHTVHSSVNTVNTTTLISHLLKTTHNLFKIFTFKRSQTCKCLLNHWIMIPLLLIQYKLKMFSMPQFHFIVSADTATFTKDVPSKLCQQICLLATACKICFVKKLQHHTASEQYLNLPSSMSKYSLSKCFYICLCSMNYSCPLSTYTKASINLSQPPTQYNVSGQPTVNSHLHTKHTVLKTARLAMNIPSGISVTFCIASLHNFYKYGY